MTIQKTVLFGIAALMMSATADAQCSRGRSIVLRPSYHAPRIVPQVTYRQHMITPYTINPQVQTTQVTQVAPRPEAITFGACSHVDDLAARLEVLLNELCLDMYYNYSHNVDFHATYTEAYTLYQTTRYIHASEHNFNRDEVIRQLGGADALFHHIQDDVRGWTRIPRRQIGTLGIIAKMDLAEDTLHHLMEDVGVQATPGLEEPPAPANLSLAPAPRRLP